MQDNRTVEECCEAYDYCPNCGYLVLHKACGTKEAKN